VGRLWSLRSAGDSSTGADVGADQLVLVLAGARLLPQPQDATKHVDALASNGAGARP
jgi:hypothetical protein